MGIRIGIDMGGTKIEVAALAPDNGILLRRRVPTPRDNYAAICRAIVALVRETEAELGERASVGLGIPGTIAPATGLVINANTTTLIGKPFKRDLEALLERPLRVENDANCMLISEVADGAAAGAASAFGVILGTGTGGALFVNGAVVTGANGIAGEWGHNRVPWQVAPGADRRCYCGHANCIETFLSGPGLVRSYQEGGGAAVSSAEAVVAAAAAGEPLAAAALRAYEQQLARALATIVNVLDPEVVVLAGGVSNIPDLPATVAALLGPDVFCEAIVTRVVRARHGDSSGVRGAAWLWGADTAGTT
jgi:fructokinase